MVTTFDMQNAETSPGESRNEFGAGHTGSRDHTTDELQFLVRPSTSRQSG